MLLWLIFHFLEYVLNALQLETFIDIKVYRRHRISNIFSGTFANFLDEIWRVSVLCKHEEKEAIHRIVKEFQLYVLTIAILDKPVGLKAACSWCFINLKLFESVKDELVANFVIWSILNRSWQSTIENEDDHLIH